MPADLDVLVVPREQQVVPDQRFHRSRRSTVAAVRHRQRLLRGASGAVTSDPVATFDALVRRGAGGRLPLAEAMTLATATPDGMPSGASS